MSVPTFEPPVGPSPGTAHKPTISLNETEFGDGYSQISPKGLNHIKKSTTLKWEVLTLDQMHEIMDFFEEMGGYLPFYYRPFGERLAIKWTCKDFSADTQGGIWSVSATFIQSFSNAE